MITALCEHVPSFNKKKLPTPHQDPVCTCLLGFEETFDLKFYELEFQKIFTLMTYSVSANVARTVAQAVTNIAGTPER